MTTMSTALDAALGEQNATIFGAIELQLPARNVRLLDGAGFVMFDGKTFNGRDDEFGVLSAIEDLTDGIGDEAPASTSRCCPRLTLVRRRWPTRQCRVRRC